MTASTYLTFSGFYHLVGETVQAFIGGLDCGDYVVDATGAVIVPFGADAGGLMTVAYLAAQDGATGENAANVNFDTGSGAAWYTVPVVIGVGYTSKGQCVRPASADDLKSPSGPALGKPRRAYEFAALLQNCVTGKLSFGTDFSATLQAAELRTVYTDPATALPETTLFSGVLWGALNGPSDFDSMVTWQVTRPVPATIAALTTFLEGQER